MRRIPPAWAAVIAAEAMFVLTIIALPLFADEAALHLADRGATDYTIVLPDTPSPVQETAAGELASFLKQVTGADFPILSESQIEGKARDKEKLLVIGPGHLSRELLQAAGAEPEETIGYDGIILQRAGSSLVFSGHPKRGTLYAIYTFLEDTVGCRWWTSTESTIPRRPTLEVNIAPTRYEPKVTLREEYYLDPHNGDEGGIFSARSKMNGCLHPIPPEFGGHEIFCFFVHSFYPILPPEDYFDEHPEWYALVDGQRRSDGAQLCLTNPEMKRQFIRNALRFLKETPRAGIISVSQNDCGGWCQCPECQKLADENNSQAGPLLTFVNDVAEAIENEFPDVFIETLAYQESRYAPTKVRPRDNVLIRLCTIENSFLTPLEEGGPNQSLVEQIEKWSAISKQLYIWDYVTNFSDYLLPHPNLQVLAPNIRFFVRNRAVGIYEEGDGECPAGDFVRLRGWVIAKLLWNPDLDQRRLEDEFLTGYYSPNVGKILRQYLDVLTQSALSAEVYLSCFRDQAGDWLRSEALVQATALIERAIAAAEEDERADPVRFAGLVKKVLRESIPIRYVWIREWRDYIAVAEEGKSRLPIDSERIDFCREIKTLLEENGVSFSRGVDGPEESDRWLEQIDESITQMEEYLDTLNAPSARQ